MRFLLKNLFKPKAIETNTPLGKPSKDVCTNAGKVLYAKQPEQLAARSGHSRKGKWLPAWVAKLLGKKDRPVVPAPNLHRTHSLRAFAEPIEKAKAWDNHEALRAAGLGRLVDDGRGISYRPKLDATESALVEKAESGGPISEDELRSLYDLMDEGPYGPKYDPPEAPPLGKCLASDFQAPAGQDETVRLDALTDDAKAFMAFVLSGERTPASAGPLSSQFDATTTGREPNTGRDSTPFLALHRLLVQTDFLSRLEPEEADCFIRLYGRLTPASRVAAAD